MTISATIGQMIHWTEVADPKAKEAFPSRTRCGVVHATDEGGGVSVLLTSAVDPECPEDEEGKALAIPAGTWRVER